jgi:hypothetical protein
LRSDATEPLPQWPFTMTAVAIVGSLALSLLIVIST